MVGSKHTKRVAPRRKTCKVVDLDSEQCPPELQAQEKRASPKMQDKDDKKHVVKRTIEKPRRSGEAKIEEKKELRRTPVKKSG